MTSETRNVSCISQLPKADKSKGAARLSKPPTTGFLSPCNDPSEIKSAVCGVDRKIIVLRGIFEKYDIQRGFSHRTLCLALLVAANVNP